MTPLTDVERAERYGRSCRGAFEAEGWEQCEPDIRRHWSLACPERAWDEAKALIRNGWEKGPLDFPE